MNEKLSLLFSKLIENSKLVEEFSKRKTLDELYKFCISLCDGYTIDEFKEFLNMLIYVNSKFDKQLEEISDASLESVAGGIDFRKHKNEMLAMLIAGALVGGAGYAHSNLGADGSNDFASVSALKSAEDTQENIQKLASNVTANAENAVRTMADTAEKLLGKVLDVTSPSASAMYSDDFPLPSAPSLEDTIHWPTASKITYGQKVNKSWLSGGSSAAGGRFDWHPMYQDLPAPEVGTWMCRVVFTSGDISYESDIPVTVEKATPVVSSPSASSITYGQTLNSSTISSSRTSVPGTFRWENRNQKLNAGTHKVSAIFEPHDKKHYNSVYFTVSVKVRKANVRITSVPLAHDITYGQLLRDSSLMGGQASISGSFRWSDPFYKPNAGTPFASIDFIPFDKNYSSCTIQIPVVVNKADPSFSKKNVCLSYKPDLKLKDISLPSGWEWEKPHKFLNKIGVFNYKAYHRGDSNYNSKTEIVTIEIEKAEPTLRLSSITYDENTTLKDIQLPVGWSWNNPDDTPVVLKSSYSASFDAQKAGTEFFHSRNNVMVNLKVNPKTPVVTKWPKITNSLVYGHRFDELTLSDGKASVPGRFVVKDTTIGFNLNVGTHECTIEFQSSSHNYRNVYGTDTVKVVKNMIPMDAPKELKVVKRKNHSIILEENSKLEYSIDGGKTWQESNVFDNLKSSTKYYIIARFKETRNNVAGKPSEKHMVKTRSWIGNLFFG